LALFSERWHCTGVRDATVHCGQNPVKEIVPLEVRFSAADEV
jgi:hypothetical protein